MRRGIRCDNKNGTPKNAGVLQNNIIMIVNCCGHGRHSISISISIQPNPIIIIKINKQEEEQEEEQWRRQARRINNNQNRAAAIADSGSGSNTDSSYGSGYTARGPGRAGLAVGLEVHQTVLQKNNANQGKLASIQCANVVATPTHTHTNTHTH